ncbi:putative Tetratricopeptide repeat protein [Gammaproteobacteria bacterium]
MNRNQRRRAMKQDKRSQPSTPPAIHGMFADAIQHHQAGRLSDARIIYEKILEAEPTYLAALNNLGLISPPHEASTLFRKALTIKPDYTDAHINLATVLQSEGKSNDAIAHYQRALAIQPDRPHVHLVLGTIFQNQGNLDEAAASYRRASTFKPDYIEAYVNLGTIFRIQRKLDDAMMQFKKALSFNSEHPDAFFGLGAVLQEKGELDEALGYYQQVLTVKPEHPEVLFSVGTVLHGQGKLDEAVAFYQRLLAVKPNHVNACNNLGAALYSQGKVDEAITLYHRAITLQPTCAEAHNNLGDALKDLRKLDEAVASYQQAIALKPNFALALSNLGIVYSVANQFGPAAEWYRRALAIDPNLGVANMNLASILEHDGRLAEAQIYRGRVPRPQPLVIDTAQEHRRNVLILSAAGDGNVPIDPLIPQQFNTRIRWSVECATDGQQESLPPYNVVFNAIGNADLIGPSLTRMTDFMHRCRRPVLNRPECVLPTRRDLMPRLLAGIPNVVAPPVMRLSRKEVIRPKLAERLAAGGVTCPLIVRPISGQGGLGIILVETPEQLAEATFTEADVFYFIAYRDYQSPDGYYRKYRTIFVDRRPYPYHLAISPRWLVHYFSAEMLATPWKHEEERRFLEAPATALGPVVTAAIEAISQRMDMDYAGIDYSILPDGQVLVFEANATMSVVLPDAKDFPYKQSYIQTIYAAFEAMLERCGTMPSQGEH